jgi:hypothetical protein
MSYLFYSLLLLFLLSSVLVFVIFFLYLCVAFHFFLLFCMSSSQCFLETQREQYERTLDLMGADKAKAEKELGRLRGELEAAIAKVSGEEK